ncbi:MAG: DUF3168 domain-containing protein [Alphaproteobacteria bacterium]|nr:DUF3168 domain-containing protein [Alphaproteobacteria bacterium]
MSIEQVIIARLKGFAELNNLIAGRVYSGIAPKGTANPLVMFQEISSEPIRTMGGDTGLVRARYQFDVYAKGSESRINVTTALKKALRRWKDGTTEPQIEVCYIQSSADMFEDKERLYRKRIDVEVNYVESL